MVSFLSFPKFSIGRRIISLIRSENRRESRSTTKKKKERIKKNKKTAGHLDYLKKKQIL
jgi:hypothetical protein